MGKTKITKVDLAKDGFVPFKLGEDIPTIYVKQESFNVMTFADETGKILAKNVVGFYYNEEGRFVAKTKNPVNGKQSKVVVIDKNKNVNLSNSL